MFLIDKIRMIFYKAKTTPPLEDTEAHQQRLSLLTTPEYKIFMLLREGFSNKECSQRLNMRRGDINGHVKSIYSKLSVRSSAELIMKYHEDR